ncbi:competence protein ComK, partial [Staphylococcus epidermidis]|uniref:competence protein ComK n=2 Tax=Staphylococcus TaxID=1279 RepID=UPI000F88364C
PEKTLHYLLELHQKSYHHQCMLSKNILNIKKLIPIYINEETILFPVTQKRASIKYFINARNIIGIHSSIHTTKIVFENGSTIEVNIPYTLVTKKWQESLTVGHIIEKTTFY